MVQVRFHTENRGGWDEWSKRREVIEEIEINGNVIPLFVTDTSDDYVFETSDGVQLGHELDWDCQRRIQLDSHKLDHDGALHSLSEQQLEEKIESGEIVVRDRYL